MTKRRPDDEQFDLFVPRFTSLPLKDQREMMERPFFALSKKKRLKPIEYGDIDGEAWVRVSGNPQFGIATIWDADVLIWATSRLNQMRERGVNDLPRTIQTTPHELLKSIRRDTGGKAYHDLQSALQRLEATTIQTSIRGTKRQRLAQFGWIDSWTIDVDTETGIARGMSLTLSDWVYNGVLRNGGLLTLHPDYFTLSGGVERAIYRIARKHAGDQPGGWTCRVSVLYEKTGAESPLKQFAYKLRQIVAQNTLPEYIMSEATTADGSAAVHFVRIGAAERESVRQAIAREKADSDRRAREDARAAEVDALMASGARRVRGFDDQSFGGSVTDDSGDQ